MGLICERVADITQPGRTFDPPKTAHCKIMSFTVQLFFYLLLPKNIFYAFKCDVLKTFNADRQKINEIIYEMGVVDDF